MGHCTCHLSLRQVMTWQQSWYRLTWPGSSGPSERLSPLSPWSFAYVPGWDFRHQPPRVFPASGPSGRIGFVSHDAPAGNWLCLAQRVPLLLPPSCRDARFCVSADAPTGTAQAPSGGLCLPSVVGDWLCFAQQGPFAATTWGDAESCVSTEVPGFLAC